MQKSILRKNDKIVKGIVLPSQRRKNNTQKNPYEFNFKKKSTNHLAKVKWTIIIGVIIAIYLFYNPILNYIHELLKLNPTIYSYYLLIVEQISNNTLSGLFVTAVLGSIFFITIPAEAIFIYYLSSTTHFFAIIILIVVVGNLLGLIFNYFFGRALGPKVLGILFSEKSFESYREKIDKYGGYLILFGNILPGPIEAITVFFGGFRFNFARYAYLCFIGRLIKYILLFLLFYFFWDKITLGYDSFLQNLLVLKDFYLK